MRHRRVMSIWFPHLGAERILRTHRGRIMHPFAVINDNAQILTLSSISQLAREKGLMVGQSLSDARALCPDLMTALSDPIADTDFMTTLKRWANQFSPWVSRQGETGLCLDITGCAHLFGGEEDMIAKVMDQTAELHLTAEIGIADTVGAAWALARFSNTPLNSNLSGDAVEQEARATRSRAFKRRNWERGGARPEIALASQSNMRIAPPGKTSEALAMLPVNALRIPNGTALALARVGLRQIKDLIALPRASIARRFGADVLSRLDQATGSLPEPVSPSKPPIHFVTRLSFPDPIGLPEDIQAGIERLLMPLCAKLKSEATGCRKLQLTLMRSDGTSQLIQAGLARASHDPERILPLLTLQMPNMEPGHGIDVMRLQALVTEPLSPYQHSGPIEALATAQARRNGDMAEADLIGRLGARIGLEGITQLHPAQSTIPEKAETRHVTAYTKPLEEWAAPHLPRPLILFQPEHVTVTKPQDPLSHFVWRRRQFRSIHAIGPERISPEWWLDDPNWRSGVRDYWCVTTQEGPKLWLFKTQPNAWSCHGVFA